jgi:hypothetical protein
MRSRGRALRGVFAWAARVGLATPVASYLSQLWPWWRWSPAGYAVSLGALAVLLAVLARLLGRAAGRDAELVALPGLTAAVLFADQIAGAPLQLSAPLGDNPIVAGRFHGMGNVDFALFAASVLLCAAVVGGRLRAGGRGRLAVAAPAVLALLGIAVDAAPSLGDDFGGLLAFLPAAVVLVAVLSSGPEGRLRWRPRRVAGLVVALVAVGVAVALGDYARPAASQTHVGAFVGTVLHGGAGSVLSRKFSAMGRSFGDVAVTGFVGVVVVVGVLARRAVAVIVAALPGGAAAALAVAVLALLGTVLNDSGVVVAEMALLVPVLAVVAGRADEVLPDASRPTSRPRRR